MHLDLRHRLALLAISTWAAHAVAGTVALDPTQAAAAASGATATSQRADEAAAAGIDLGDAGKLVRLVEDAERNHVTRVQPKPALIPGDPRDALLPPKGRARTDSQAAPDAAMSIQPEILSGESSDAARPQVIREGSETTYSDPNAGRGLIDQATPEQRNTIRELVMKIRSMVESPLAWIGIAVLAIGVLAVSAAGRRSK